MGSRLGKRRMDDGEVVQRGSTSIGEYGELAEAMVERQAQRVEAADASDPAASPPPWQRVRKVVMVLCLAGCCLSWAPQVRATDAPAPTAIGADMDTLVEAQPIVRSLWQLRIAFDGWRARNAGALPATLAVLPSRYRTCPVARTAWTYTVDLDDGSYRIAAPAPGDVGVRAIWLDERRGPPQVQR